MNELKNKVCPGCGAEPSLAEPRDKPDYCPYCGERLVTRAELPRDIWKDPGVKEALASRAAWDIAVLRCPECHQIGYYNEGSTFSCRFCDLTFYVIGADDRNREGIRTVCIDDVIQLDDTVTETTDGYHNHTL